jgi:hypothetical protein
MTHAYQTASVLLGSSEDSLSRRGKLTVCIAMNAKKAGHRNSKTKFRITALF